MKESQTIQSQAAQAQHVMQSPNLRKYVASGDQQQNGRMMMLNENQMKQYHQ